MDAKSVPSQSRVDYLVMMLSYRFGLVRIEKKNKTWTPEHERATRGNARGLKHEHVKQNQDPMRICTYDMFVSGLCLLLMK